MKQGNYVTTVRGYKAFEPSKLPVPVDINRLLIKLEQANIAIGSLNLIHLVLPDYTLLIRPYEVKEALLSSMIEGTQSTLSSVLAEKENTSNNDIREVQNYEAAIRYGITSELPLCNRLFKELHYILMRNVRGGSGNKTPGEFRVSQNWIGGHNIQTAKYIPCSQETLQEHLSDLEKFMNDTNDNLPRLIKASLIHYQFETIHPFLDGNGRIGRMLITLYLIKNGILKEPILYLSLFLKENRDEYYNLLTNIRENGDYERWINFFLDGVIDISQRIQEKTEKIIDLKNKLSSIDDKYNFIDFLFKKPIVEISDLTKNFEISDRTAFNILARFEDVGIIKEISGKKKNKRYCFVDYVNVLENDLRNK
jgi:Fic family protein